MKILANPRSEFKGDEIENVNYDSPWQSKSKLTIQLRQSGYLYKTRFRLHTRIIISTKSKKQDANITRIGFVNWIELS